MFSWFGVVSLVFLVFFVLWGRHALDLSKDPRAFACRTGTGTGGAELGVFAWVKGANGVEDGLDPPSSGVFWEEKPAI